MYKAFKTEIKLQESRFNKFYEIGDDVYKSKKVKIDDHLKKYRKSDGSLQGSKLSANWFPQIKADIFISHSHKDLKTALKLAGWLYEKQNIDCFIDSCIWGYADDLLMAIDNEYCYESETKSYDYQKRNFSTSHVHMMLSIALSRMIYNTECLFFLNTPQSIIPKSVIKDSSTSETLSPWIFAEIEMTRLVEKRDVNTHRQTTLKEITEESKQLSIRHEVDLSHLKEITFKELVLWGCKKYRDKHEALDALYSTICAKGVING
jgi:hypothetical protein